MNSTALATIVVAICVICPVGFGFIWPGGEVTETGYTTEGNMDVTQALNNDTAPTEYAYTSYLNNMFYWLNNPNSIYPDGYWVTGTESIELTTTPNSYPQFSTQTREDWEYHGVVDLMNSSVAAIQVDAINSGWITLGESTDQRVDHLLLFPGADIGYAMKGDDGASYDLIQLPKGKFYVYSSTIGEDNVRLTKWSQATDNDGNKLYADLSAGTMMEGVWMNGETNSKASLIVDLYGNSYVITAGNDATIYLDDTSDTMMASIDGLTWKSIGSRNSYPKLMVEFDSTDNKIVVTGLMDMPTYSGYTPSKRGNSVSFDKSFDPFKTIDFSANSPGVVLGVVYMTSILTDPVAVMNDATLRYTDFYPDNQLSMNVRNITQYGDSMTFIVTENGVSESVTLTVQDGYLTNVPFFGEDGDTYQDVPLRNLIVALIPDTSGNFLRLMMNGKLTDLGTFHGNVQTTDVFEIRFDGIWKAAISIQQVIPYEYSSYTWAVGNFGVSESGFCTIGMMTAVFMTVVCSLYARSSGMSAVIPLISSIGCAGVYLTLLFVM